MLSITPPHKLLDKKSTLTKDQNDKQQDQGSQFTPQVVEYNHTFPKYPLKQSIAIYNNVAVVETIKT